MIRPWSTRVPPAQIRATAPKLIMIYVTGFIRADMHWKAALIFVAVIPVLSVVVFGVMLWTMPRYKQVQAGLDKVLGLTRENLTGVRVVRAFGREESEVEGFEAQNNALTTPITSPARAVKVMPVKEGAPAPG